MLSWIFWLLVLQSIVLGILAFLFILRRPDVPLTWVFAAWAISVAALSIAWLLLIFVIIPILIIILIAAVALVIIGAIAGLILYLRNTFARYD